MSRLRNHSSKHASSELNPLATERNNPASKELDSKSSRGIVRIINAEDAKVAPAVKRALPQIATAVDWIAEALGAGGRLIYVGAGTSGRLAALDAAECPPTFNTNPALVQFVMAGGIKALSGAIEADEDSRELGVREIRKKKPRKGDIVVGIAASGRTPFTVSALEFARRLGAKTIAITCNRNSPLERAAELAIVVETGPEVVAGSTRMKAGTAQKMVLNMLSTGAMVKLGYVYGNLMVNVHQENSKLMDRAMMILRRALEVSASDARRLLRAAGNKLPVAIVMAKTGAPPRAAEQALRVARGNVRKAIALVPKMQ